MVNCHKCNTPTSYDWRSGKDADDADPNRVLCRKCFIQSINNLCDRIRTATPATLDAVFITGMAEFNASDESLLWCDTIDASENDDQEIF